LTIKPIRIDMLKFGARERLVKMRIDLAQYSAVRL